MRAKREPSLTRRKLHSGAESASPKPAASHHQSYRPPGSPQRESATHAAHPSASCNQQDAARKPVPPASEISSESTLQAAAPTPSAHSPSVQPNTYPRSLPLAINPALTLSSETPFSCRRALDTS